MAKRFTRSSKMINIIQNTNNTIANDDFYDNNIVETNVTVKKRKINSNTYIQPAKSAELLSEQSLYNNYKSKVELWLQNNENNITQIDNANYYNPLEIEERKKVTSLVVDTVKNDNYTDVQNTEYFSLLALKPDEKNSNDEIEHTSFTSFVDNILRNDNDNNLNTEFFSLLTSKPDKQNIDYVNEYSSSCSEIDDSNKDKDWVIEKRPKNSISSESLSADENVNNSVRDIEADYVSNHPGLMNTALSTTDAAIGQTNSRKKSKSTKKWTREVRKKERNLGESYQNSKGLIIEKRKLQPSCNSKCKYKCSSNFTEVQREQILQAYWKMGDLTRQRAFIVKSTTIIKPKHQYKKENSNRLSNNAFFLHLEGTNYRVCKLFFMATLNIGDRTIRTALKKGGFNKDHVEGELRGNHGKQKKLNPEIVSLVTNHINEFPRIESHYLRKQTTRQYIDGALTIAEMYRLFVKKCEDNRQEACKFSTYSYIFNTHFNIGFFIPKKDQCAFCEMYNNSNENDQLKLKNEKYKHTLETELSRNQKQNDKNLAQTNKEKIIVACYDLQSVLTTPSAQVSNFYYSRKFATYNLTVYNMGISEAHCYLWNEDQAKRGANEIATCVYQFLIENCVNKNTIFYSDNCSGQQKNKFMATLYLYAVTYLNIPSITHNYLIVGHTQNEGDSVHSVIEKQKIRLLKGGSIYSPQQWVTVIQSAKKTGKPFKVHELNYQHFINFKQLTSNMGNNFNKNNLGQKVVWKDIKVLKVSKEHPDRLFYKTSNEEPDFGEIIIINKTRNAKKKNNVLELSKLFTEPPGISKEKKKDLIHLCESNLIPENYQYFFKQLKVSNSCIDENSD